MIVGARVVPLGFKKRTTCLRQDNIFNKCISHKEILRISLLVNELLRGCRLMPAIFLSYNLVEEYLL